MHNTLKLGRLSVTAACCALLVATPAFSQNIAAPQLADGLFGATRSDAGARDRLTFLFAGSEGLDSELPPVVSSQVPQGALQSGGLFTTLTAAVDYARSRRRVQWAANALTAFRYYRPLDRVSPVSDSAGIGLTVRLPKQGSLQIAETAAYAPSYLYQLFPTAALPAPEEAAPANPDYRIEATASYLYGTRMALAFGSARGTRVTTTAEYSHVDFKRQIAAGPDPTTYAAGASVSHPVSRNGGLSVGYQYRTGTFEFGGRTKEHRVTMGVNYALPVSRTRRATLHLNVTPERLEFPVSAANIESGLVPSTVERPVPSAVEGPVPSADRGRLYRLQGEAGIDYQFRLNWRATANYGRGVEYLLVLTEPVFSDGARVGLNGLIGRRVDVSASAAYATGASAINRGGTRLKTATGDIQIRYALQRSLALYSQYVYYYYDLREQARLAPGVPTLFKQRGVRVGFMLFVAPLGR